MNRRDFLAALAALGIAKDSLAAFPQSTGLLRAPYLQNTRFDGTSILWASHEAVDAVVECAAADGIVRQAVPSLREFPASEFAMPLFRQYRADFSELSSDTDYVYRVVMGGVEAAHGRFRTAGSGPFRFVAIGDSGQGTMQQRQLAERIGRESANFLLHVGDMAYFSGTQAECQWNHFEIYRNVLPVLPYFAVPGNHEYIVRNAAPFLNIHAAPSGSVPAGDQGRYYSFDWGNVHFVCLDSNAPLFLAAKGEGGMLEWLQADLGATRQPWRVAMIHHPPYPSGPNQNDLEVHLVRNHIVPILEAHGVQLVLSGHEHSYQRTQPIRNGAIVPSGTGTVYVITGGAGAALYPTFSHPFHASARSAHHYLSCEVNELEMVIRAVGLDGKEIDGFALRPKPLVEEKKQRLAITILRSTSGTYIAIRGRHLASIARQIWARPFPLEIAGTSVQVDRTPLPLMYVSESQVVGYMHDRSVATPFLLQLKNVNGVSEVIVRE